MPSNPLFVVLVVVIGALGTVLVLAVSHLGVTMRRARRRLARAEASERLSEQIIENLSSGLLVVGVTGRIRILNPAARRLLGVTVRHPDGLLRDLLDPAVAPLVDVIDGCLATMMPAARRTLQLDASGRSGVPSHLGVSVSPLWDERGTLQGAICLCADLTVVVDLEERVRLQESLAQVGELAAGVAHEFRNGLSTIHGYSRLIPLDRVHAEYRPFIESIREETVALREVIDKFLGFARPARLSVATISLRRVVERATDDLREEANAHGGCVTMTGEFPEVEGDEVLLRQAIGNLCRNAVDACVESGRPPEVVVQGWVDRDHHQARLTVTDNGPGFDPAQRDHLFRPFFTTKGHGTGLGLAVTQKIIVTHNGTVTASNSETGGARMEVTLPLRRMSHIA